MYTTEPLFRYSDDKAELFQLPLMLRAALHDINSRGVDAGVSEQVGQLCDVFLHPVERDGEQVAEVMGEHLAAVYARVVAQSLKLLPDVGAVQGLSVFGDEHGSGRDVRLFAVGQQFLAQALRDEDDAPLALAVHGRAPVPERLHGDGIIPKLNALFEPMDNVIP